MSGRPKKSPAQTAPSGVEGSEVRDGNFAGPHYDGPAGVDVRSITWLAHRSGVIN
jgi:hypothetical protein